MSKLLASLSTRRFQIFSIATTTPLFSIQVLDTQVTIQSQKQYHIVLRWSVYITSLALFTSIAEMKAMCRAATVQFSVPWSLLRCKGQPSLTFTVMMLNKTNLTYHQPLQQLLNNGVL